MSETETDDEAIHGNHRARLEAMGAVKVRMAMDQGILVWHLHEPALEWLAELEAKKEKPDASTQG